MTDRYWDNDTDPDEEDPVFVCGSISETGESGTFCFEHIPPKVMENIGEPFVDTWRTSDSGWTADVRCDVCGKLLAKKDEEGES